MEVDSALELWLKLDEPRGLARTLLSKAWIASRVGANLDELLPLAEEAAHQAELSGEEHIVAECLAFRGWVKSEDGKPDEARADMGRAVAIDRRTHDLWTLALHLDILGGLDYNLGWYELARAHFAEFLDLCRTVGDHLLLANAMTDMAMVEMAQHEDSTARRDFEAALTIEGTSYPDAKALVGLAEIAARQGYFERALKLHGAAWAMPWVRVRSRFRSLESQPWIAAARRALGTQAAEAAWRTGAAMTTPQALAYALSDADESPTGGGPLTAREQQIATLVARGLRNRDIAAQLHISPRTVDAHVEHIRNKLGHQSRAQVAAWVTAQGLLQG